MAATTCASEGTAGRKVILLASAMVRHATQRRLGKKADGRSLVQPATWPALAELAGEQPSASRHPAGSMLFVTRRTIRRAWRVFPIPTRQLRLHTYSLGVPSTPRFLTKPRGSVRTPAAALGYMAQQLSLSTSSKNDSAASLIASL